MNRNYCGKSFDWSFVCGEERPQWPGQPDQCNTCMKKDLQEIPLREIGEIENNYGNLVTKKTEGICLWGIEDWDGTKWKKIPQSLFDELNKHQDSLEH